MGRGGLQGGLEEEEFLFMEVQRGGVGGQEQRDREGVDTVASRAQHTGIPGVLRALSAWGSGGVGGRGVGGISKSPPLVSSRGEV